MDYVTSTMVFLVITTFVITIFASILEWRNWRRRKKEPTLQDKISNFADSLSSSPTLIIEIQEEISKKRNELEKLQEDIKIFTPLKEINQAAVEAVARVFETPLKKESRKSIIINLTASLLIAVTFFLLGYFVGSK